MAEFTGGDLDLEFNRAEAVEITVVGGDVAVTAGVGPVRVRGVVVRGEPLDVRLEGGRLTIQHELSRALVARIIEGTSPEAVVEVVAPPETEVRVRTVSAAVVVAGFRARPTLASVSGRITASDVGGLTVSTISGVVEAQSVVGPLAANAVSGDVSISGGRLEGTTVKTVSGEVLIDVDGIGPSTITAISGSVALRLPEDTAAVLEAGTLNGRLDCAFPLADTVSTRRRLAGAIGGGGPELRCRTVSGDVAVLRRKMVSA